MDMNEQTIGPAERAHYLAAIERVATKLADLARDQRMNEQAPYAQDFLMARHIHLLLEPAIALMPRHLRPSWRASWTDCGGITACAPSAAPRSSTPMPWRAWTACWLRRRSKPTWAWGISQRPFDRWRNRTRGIDRC
jgi:hypothetical protein